MKKNAVVTGAAGNLGKAVVRKLLEAGYWVIGTISPGKDDPEQVSHPNFESYPLDVTDQKAINDFIHYTVAKMGQIHFSALLVGGFDMHSFEDTSLEDIHKMMKLNFETAFISSQTIFKQMKQQPTGGIILFVGAKPAIEKGASKGMTAYALSKSLIFKLAEHINTEGADYQVQASVIVPSVIDTPQNRKAMPNADFSQWITPEQIAESILFLANQPPRLMHETILKLYGNA
ncbi:SDR family NAD(P)-dependent oxidoreductase [Catalinimonas niigatensis]|uniref:SDR family NAD(P)-dependent oxidoreductase n=1 Tax=Catalinimonas niigatensis TaxID=1397264 RepID=UPI002665E82E|nr:SDR family NAD(P)-dependent oxidoreductase [Catalinimonas niigatensis]WPP51283.1 SDR family NAD(P)-dependent oxidoreductase [Catalinimonas niigatensis]